MSGITLLELSERSGISYQGIHRIMRTNSAKMESLERIADSLGIGIVEFIYEANDQYEKYLIPNNYFNGTFSEISCNRYERFADKMSIIFDLYIGELNRMQGLLDKVRYPLKHSDRPVFMFENYPEINRTFSDIYLHTDLPFSMYSDESKRKITSITTLMEGFYFPLFKTNYLLINDNMRVGLINDKLIQKNWKTWNILTNNGKNIDLSPFMECIGKLHY